MKLTLQIGESGQEKTILCDDFIDCVHLKEMCCREAFTPESMTRIYFGEKLLSGDKLAQDFDVTDGATIKVVSPGL